MAFCGSCGTQLSGIERFCGQCGAPNSSFAGGFSPAPDNNYQPPAPIPLAVQSPVLDVLPNVKNIPSTGSYDIFTLVFTDKQVIMAKLTGEIIRDMQQQSQVRGKAEGKGWISRAREGMKAAGAVGERYGAMTPMQVIAETAGNFAIEHALVASVNIRLVWEPTNEDGPGDPWSELIFTTMSGSLRYRVRMQTKDVIAMLGKFYPGRVARQR